MKNLIACRPGSYRKFSDRAFEYLPKAGIHHVEISPPKPGAIRETQTLLRKHGLTASSLATGCDLSSAESVSELLQTIDTARKMDVQVIFCSTKSGGLPGNKPYDALKELGHTATDHQTVISMETHPDLCQNSKQMLNTMETVEHPGIRVNFDTANIYYYNEGVDGVSELRKVARYVASVHLKDTNGKPRTWFFPTLGKGIVDFRGVFKVLNDRGFHGPFTFEMEGIEGEDLTLEETHQRIVDSMEHLRSIGVI